MNLVSKKYHHYLKEMISELQRTNVVKNDCVWWQVSQLTFTRPKSMSNYEPIARFVMQTAQDGNEGLNCSISTFVWYLTDAGHSNLIMKFKSAKSLIFGMIGHLNNNKNGIF